MLILLVAEIVSVGVHVLATRRAVNCRTARQQCAQPRT